jgi:hypothetical protein
MVWPQRSRVGQESVIGPASVVDLAIGPASVIDRVDLANAPHGPVREAAASSGDPAITTGQTSATAIGGTTTTLTTA